MWLAMMATQTRAIWFGRGRDVMAKGVNVKVKVEEKQDRDFVRMIEEHQKLLRKPYVDVGVLGGEHKPEESGGQPISNIGLARIHEYGTATIPERSFIRSTLFENRPMIVELIKEMKTKIYSGKMTVDKALDIIGLQLQTLIRGKIQDGDPAWPPNTDETIKRKGSSKPLIDTGQLLKSITYKKVIK